MTTVYKFKAFFTTDGVGGAPASAPTCTVINLADDSKVADAQATSASTNIPGLYSYSYSGNDNLDLVALFHTATDTVDQQDLCSYTPVQITDIAVDVDAVLLDTGTDGVKISAGTGAGQLDFTSGVVKANLAQILGTALTETSGLIAAGFKKFFNIATPTGTVNSLPDAVPGANGGLPTQNGSKLNQTADLTAGQTIPTVTNLTNLPAIPTDWLTAAGVKADAVTKIQNGLATPTNITAGTITTVTNLTNAPTNGDLTAAMKTSVTTAAASATPVLSAAGVDAILDEVVVGTFTMRQLLAVMSSALAGKVTGGGTTTLTFRGINDASNVIVATVDASGNRSALTITV